MAKREIKAVEASSDVAAIIDRGADIDSQIKNLGFEDKGIKTRIVEIVKTQLNENELSVRLIGKTSAAVVSGVEKFEMDVNSEDFKTVREACYNGFLVGIVDRTVSLILPPGEVEEAAEILKKAGIRATVTESFSLKDNSVLSNTNKSFVGSLQVGDAICALSKCVTKDLSFRVKYEKV